MADLKKLMIIIILMVFMIQAVSAGDIDESISVGNDAFISASEIVEVNQIDEISISVDDIEESEDIVFEDFAEDIIYEESHCQDYNDSDIIESYESFEVESINQYNDTYIDAILNETLGDDSDYNLNYTATESFHISNYFNDFEVFICMKIDTAFKTADFDRCEFRLFEFKEFDIVTHDILAFYNDYCNVLTHAVNKNIILCSDKLNSKFAFCIDNSIVGRANSLSCHVLYSNFLILNFTSLSFSQTSFTSEYLFDNFYLIECVYCFPGFKQSNERGIFF